MRRSLRSIRRLPNCWRRSKPNKIAANSPSVRAAPPQPHRLVQQAPDGDIDPFLAELLGMVKERAQPVARPLPPPQRQQRVQQTPGRVASENGLAKIFGSTR